MDNVALRAELARQVELIRESRARLATAHLEERRRIERDLHDGAQQRLLAIALQLQSARLNGDGGVLVDGDRPSDRGPAGHRAGAARPRRRAAAGGPRRRWAARRRRRPRRRAPVAVTYDVVDERFPSDLESAAWFVVAEAVTNAVKHSGADRGAVRVHGRRTALAWRSVTRAVGAADPSGSGLQGLADRVAAVGGSLRVAEADPHGTSVEAVFPCAS